MKTTYFSPELRTLFAILGEHKTLYLWGCLFLISTDLIQLGIPWLVGRVIDRLATGNLTENGLIQSVGTILVSMVLIAVTRVGWPVFIFGAARRIDRDLRARLYAHLQSLSQDFFLQRKVGELMTLATNDIQAVRAAASEGVMAGFDAIVMVIGAAVMVIATVDWRLGLLAFTPLMLLPYATYWIGQRMKERFSVVQNAFGQLGDRAQEGIAGIRVVKGFVREDYQNGRFQAATDAYRVAYAHMCRVEAASDPVIALLAAPAFAIGLLYGGHLALAGQLSVGQYVAFNTFLGMLSWPLLAIGWAINLVQRATASLTRLQAIFDEVPTVRDLGDSVSFPRPQGHLKVQGLSFRYKPDTALVLDNITFEAAPGQTIGITGLTGAGKTTLANLLTRVFNPPVGQVFLDDVDVHSIALADLRSAIAYVPQDGFLFSRTIAENLAFDPRPRVDEEIKQAGRLAQLEADVEALPDGYQTLVGERGVMLSGGQRQRVGIARAILKDACVLILDDCLSAVDTLTEARLLSTLREHMAGRTTLVISHRIAALQQCDEILVLEGGRVCERGRHTELIAQDGIYARLHRLQQFEAAIEEL